MPRPPKHPLKKVASVVRPTSFLSYRDYLQQTYLWLKESMGSYSYVKFAEDLGFSKTNVVHLIIQGKRQLTQRTCARVHENLHFSPLDTQYFETLVKYNNETDSGVRESLFQELLAIRGRLLPTTLEKNQLEYYSAWYHPVVREIVGLEGFKNDPEWIANRIVPRISIEQVRQSLKLLVSLGLIRYVEDRNSYEQASPFVSTGDDVLGLGIIRYHQKTIELGRESITRFPAKRRDVSCLTVCVSEDLAIRIKKEIRRFRKEILALIAEEEKADQIYQMNIQLFPFTK